MSGLQDTTLLSPTSLTLPSRPAGSPSSTHPDQRGSVLRPRRSLAALTNLVRDPWSTFEEIRQGWDGLSAEERAERVRIQARKQVLYMNLREATTYDDWRNAAVELDDLEGNNVWKQDTDSPDYDPEEIRIRLDQLDAARISCDTRRMLFLIRTSLTRNLGNMGNIRLYSKSFVGTKDLIEQYINSALETLNVLLQISEQGPSHGLTSKMMLDQVLAARQAFGRSALLLSGGANFGMNHIGVLKALWEQRMLPRIISGASAGSIVCAMLCTHPDEEIPEILETFANGDLAVFEEKGSQGSIIAKVTRLLKYGSIFDVSVLTNVVRDMVGDLTFQEAYNRTRRILNICVSSASLYELPRLLNYITAPNVLIWSAVAASCSVPLIFTAATILAKDPLTGEHVPWNSSPQKWIDGSVDNDLPMTRLAEMFNVNHFIVSQVNPHVVPFIAKEEEAALRQNSSNAPASGPSGAPSWMYTITGLAKSEAIYRMHTLIDFGFFPNTLTKTVSVLSQKYSGDITILPEISYQDFPTMMSNPTVEFMEKSVLRGERATWPKFSRIRNHLAIELALDDAVQRLRTRVVFSASQADLRLYAYPAVRADGRGKRSGAKGSAREHRRTSQSSELDASAARLMKHGRSGNRLSVDSTHSKARSVNLPWSRPGTASGPMQPNAHQHQYQHQHQHSHHQQTQPPPPVSPAGPQLSDVLSSGAETSNVYTTTSEEDTSAVDSSSSETESPSSPTGGGSSSFFSAFSRSVPATPSAHRRIGSYMTLSSAAAGTSSSSNKQQRGPGHSHSQMQLHAPPTIVVPPTQQSQPSAQETRYKRLFHSKGTGASSNTASSASTSRAASSRLERKSGRNKSGGERSPPSGSALSGGEERKTSKRFNALGLEIDLSGAKGVMRKK